MKSPIDQPSLPYLNNIQLVGNVLNSGVRGEDYRTVLHTPKDPYTYLCPHTDHRSYLKFHLGIPNVRPDGSAWKYGFLWVYKYGNRDEIVTLRDQLGQLPANVQVFVSGQLHFSPGLDLSQRIESFGEAPYDFQILAETVQLVDPFLEVTVT